ncbi:MAG: hypothetical protein KA956_02315 [Pyrinomonadaceae bacterium]|nr:pyrroloquinoline quinone biosynthesis protein PqqB [Acidobacteriota bacterium]MBK7933332.1 pyrroloquinoline quinone biosynthesis protein PqqB [Acidobacteriota bacterium]MBP7375291.1 hypothetical protein [Pyrinomonadaceae bacterium]
MMLRLAVIVSILAFAANMFAGKPYIVVLGVGQDAGVPQIGCASPFCRSAWADPKLRQTVASLALVDPDTKQRWIFDATPDLPEQFEILKEATADRSNNITGIFLTHAHIGHYTGLMFLGRESMNSDLIPVYAMPRMKQMLEQNAPWSQLVRLKNIAVSSLADGVKVRLNDRLSVTPFTVPHRDEFSETVGYLIDSDTKAIVYIPDIDKWQKWSTPLEDLVRSANYLLLDGTFYADGEINRPMSEVPHPFVSETMDMLRTMPRKERSKVYFIHFNHSNPLVQGNKRQNREVRRKGFRVAVRGLRLDL